MIPWRYKQFLLLGTNLTMILTITGVQRRLTATAVAAVFILSAAVSNVLADDSASDMKGDAAAGEKKAYTCLGCHGVLHYVNTYPTYHVPKLGGQHQDYLIAALLAYRNKERPHGTMQANAGLLSDEDIADISAYFASQGKQ